MRKKVLDLQLQKSIGPGIFARASNAHVIRPDGAYPLVLAPSGTPRFDKGEGVLIEPACTNLESCVQRDPDDAFWTEARGTATNAQYTGPDGVANDYGKFLETTDAGIHTNYHEYTTVGSTKYIVSFVTKGIGRDYVGFYTDIGGGSYVVWNVNTGKITKQDACWTLAGNEWLGDGWIRIYAVVTASGVTTQIGPATSTDGTTMSFSGDIAKGFVFGDWICCESTSPTSIPDPATGTRAADLLYWSPSLIEKTLKIGNSYAIKKLDVEFRARNLFASAAQMGGNGKDLVSISGNTGTAGSTRNNLWFAIGATGKFNVLFCSNGSTTCRMIEGTIRTDWDKWHTCSAHIDFTNLANSRLCVDGVDDSVTYTDMSGTADFDMTNCMIRAGHYYDGTVRGHCVMDYIKAWTTE
jgi:hypothetical protein